ncbi:hypothetical protein ACFFSW_07475 [Saccharothrix longispora]|uniref:Uncharacterized protein n=1 Tax=Saccharothrix longispora TaxID=33920 RepID=A0ABU1PSN5_9PSEU|nr:hypothetical protein [Saccharothrix longispora]MDR6593656.1 hypothetical protein [Saccharothrix longispora]
MTISHNGALACPDPTPQERLLVTVAVQGAEYACSALTVEDLVEMTDPAHVIRADVIRDLLLGRHGELDPRGVRVSGARIVDRLDLDHVTAAAGVELLGCVITEPITVE